MTNTKTWLAWLIENIDEKGQPIYLTMEDGNFRWTTDALAALHFCRREDAERVCAEDEDASAVREHEFVGPEKPQ